MFHYAKYKYFLLIFDFIIILCSIYLSIFITKISGGMSSEYTLLSNITHVCIVFLSSVLIIYFKINNLYKSHIILADDMHLYQLIRSLFLWIILIVFLSFIFKIFYFEFFRTIVFFSFLSLFCSFLLLRVIIFRWIFSRYSTNPFFKWEILIIGGGNSGKKLAEMIERRKNGIQIIGFLDDKLPVGKKIFNEKVNLGHINSLYDIICSYNIDEVIIAINNMDFLRFSEIIKLCKSNKVGVNINSKLFEIIPNKLYKDQTIFTNVIPASTPVNSNVTIVIKRIFDIIIASFLIILLTPLFIIVSVLIKLTSKGPALYSQERIGKNGKVFKIYKFRSMQLGSDNDEYRKTNSIRHVKGISTRKTNTKVVNHKNVTSVGAIIRKFSIDEFPQLINVIKGDMSIVGPRPYLKYEIQNMNQWQLERINIKPGCTGVWQVYGRSNVSFKDSVILDLYYIYNSNILLDIQIMFNTIPIILKGTGGS